MMLSLDPSPSSRTRQTRRDSKESEESIPTVEEARERLAGFEGIFADMSDSACHALIQSGKDYPHGL